MNKKNFESDAYIEANIKVHTAMAQVYNSDPHFRDENKKKVRANLEACVRRLAGKRPGKLLDIGCGTGFIIDLAHDLFEEVHGIDVTEAMIQQVNTRQGKVKLQLARAEDLPFENQSFEMATAYSFLDHLHDLAPVFREIHRVLKPSGVFFSDQTANFYFWDSLKKIERMETSGFHPIVKRELTAALHNDVEQAKGFDFTPKDFQDAEYIKSQQGGLKEEGVVQLAQEIGFSRIEYRYEWYLGQAKVMHQQSFQESEIVESYLREALPLTRGLFKYVQIILVK